LQSKYEETDEKARLR